MVKQNFKITNQGHKSKDFNNVDARGTPFMVFSVTDYLKLHNAVKIYL